MINIYQHPILLYLKYYYFLDDLIILILILNLIVITAAAILLHLIISTQSSFKFNYLKLNFIKSFTNEIHVD